MRELYTVNTKELQKQYQSLGTDISRLIGDIKEFKLIENDRGLRCWEPAIPGDEQFYQELAENNWWYYLKDKKEYEVASRYIQSMAVLEVGCGEGWFATKYEISDYIGLEFSSKAADEANKRGCKVYHQEFSEYANQNPESRDVVCSFQVVEHLPSPSLYFESAYKVLRKGGICITAVPSEDSFSGTLRNNCLNCPPHHLTRWTDKCLKDYPVLYGLKYLEIIHIPVEDIHSKWFLETLLNRLFFNDLHSNQKQSKSKKLLLKIQRRIISKLIQKVGHIPEEFNIPGHTVIAIHKKS